MSLEVEAANFVQRRKAAKVDYFAALRLYEIFYVVFVLN